MGSQGQPEEDFNKCVLVTGGAGFIGSHTALQLLEDGYEVYIIDNLDNSVEQAVNKVRDLVDQRFHQNLHFFLGDLCNKEDVEKVFSLAKGQPNNCSILLAHTFGVRGMIDF